MKLKKLQIVSIVVLIVVISVTLLFYGKLPIQFALHWSSIGIPDNFTNRFWGAFSLPFITIFLLILDLIMSNLRLSKNNFYSVFSFLVIVALSIIQILSILWNTGYTIKISSIGVMISKITLSLIFISLGIFLVRTKQKVHLGVHIGSWGLSNNALDNQEVRIKTNSIVGTALVVLGLVVILLSFFPKIEKVTDEIILWYTITLVIFTYVYSSYYTRHRKINSK